LIEGLAGVLASSQSGANRGPLFTGGRSDGVLTIEGRADTSESTVHILQRGDAWVFSSRSEFP
jgi:hypothetical protein